MENLEYRYMSEEDQKKIDEMGRLFWDTFHETLSIDIEEGDGETGSPWGAYESHDYSDCDILEMSKYQVIEIAKKASIANDDEIVRLVQIDRENELDERETNENK